MIRAYFPNLAGSGGWVGEVERMKEDDFIVRWLDHKSSAVFYKSQQMAGSERGLVGVRRPRCTQGSADCSRRWQPSGSSRKERAAVMRCRPGGPRDPPLHTGPRLTRLIGLINMYARLGSPGPCEACQADIRCLVFRDSGRWIGRSVIHSDYEDVIEHTMKFNAVALQQCCWRKTDSNQPNVIISTQPDFRSAMIRPETLLLRSDTSRVEYIGFQNCIRTTIHILHF